MNTSWAFVITVAIFAAVILFALYKMGYVRTALQLYRLSFELEAGERKQPLARQRRTPRSA
jgi:hypothetical protein